MAKLTVSEKYSIQGMLHAQKTVEEIAKVLNRPEKTIQNYIDRDLEELYNTIVKVQMEKNPPVEVEESLKVKTKKPNPFIFETANKTGRVAICTEVGSQVGDSVPKKKVQSRSAKGNLWKINEEEIETGQ